MYSYLKYLNRRYYSLFVLRFKVKDLMFKLFVYIIINWFIFNMILMFDLNLGLDLIYFNIELFIGGLFVNNGKLLVNEWLYLWKVVIWWDNICELVIKFINLLELYKVNLISINLGLCL